jgi:hypothetical protein
MELTNLEAMTQDELRAFWSKWHVTTKEEAGLFLGDRKDARKVMESLACYAINKSCAIGLRLEGKIESALTYEQACEIQYEKLPEDVRW